MSRCDPASHSELGCEVVEATLVVGEVEVIDRASGRVEVLAGAVEQLPRNQRLRPVEVCPGDPRWRPEGLVLRDCGGEEFVGEIVFAERVVQERAVYGQPTRDGSRR